MDAAAGRPSRRMPGTARLGAVISRPSPLARRIVVSNLLALVLMVCGVLWGAPYADGLAEQRSEAMRAEARLLTALAARTLPTDLSAVLDEVKPSSHVFVFDADEGLVAQAFAPGPRAREADDATLERARQFAAGRTWSAVQAGGTGGDAVLVSVPWGDGGKLVLSSVAGEVERLASVERQKVLRVFSIAALVSVMLSLMLASTIASPLSRLAHAVEVGRVRDANLVGGNRVVIPDLAERPDEIGRLSVALRGLIEALYDRIDSNERFAADVAHEIKNPLASMTSAVGTLRIATRDDQRERLLEVIEHDVQRLDRLVSDISNASRLDSELVREDEDEVDLTRMLARLVEHFEPEAAKRGVDLISDLPPGPVTVRGLEARLAQVVVNLVSNALSFCEPGDAVRLWVRRRSSRVLIVVEDTGPGVPEEALDQIFSRFYSERPQDQFGDHSGLGLAISKQIVEAHGGVIWAENIRPTQSDVTSEPLGARFVVGLPG